MKKSTSILALLIFSGTAAWAQLPEDALKVSWTTPRGTARSMAIGGAMGSLGGDITSSFVNPAGIGFYKTREFVLSPGFYLDKNKSNFRGTPENSNGSTFDFGTSGLVFGRSNRYGRWTSSAFALSLNRTANFNSHVYYKGANDFSSFTEAFAEEFSLSGLPIDASLYDAPLSFGTKLANYTYLIDTVSVNGNTEIVGLPQRDAILAGTSANLNQEKSIVTKGGISELNFSMASNMDDRIYIGGGIGIPIMNYSRSSFFHEQDASGNASNNFSYAKYSEEYSLKGVGFNARLGVIIKPVSRVRLGMAIHTPNFMVLTEKTTGSLVANLENYFPPGEELRIANQDTIYTQFGVDAPQFEYNLNTPWKFLVSGSYVISEVEDVTQQKGFITADVEYVNHGGSKFGARSSQDDGYYDDINGVISDIYKSTFNFRVGGELKFNTLMTRLGFAYYGNPYEDEELDARRMNVSGGLGYRNKGFFVDLAYIHSLNRDVNFPYRLGDKANTFATLKESGSNIMLTVGLKF